MKAEGFKSHRKSNSEDLTIKYAHLYSFSHRIITEARTIVLKKKFSKDDPNEKIVPGADSFIHNGGAYVPLSDESDSGEDDSNSS